MQSTDMTRELADELGQPPSADVVALLDGADEWAVSAGMAHVLTVLVARFRPRSVLEFGAGRSSLVIASALQRSGGGRLTSIEHQPVYVQESWSRIAAYPAVDAVLVHAPLRMRLSKHGLWYQYAGIRRTLATRGPFDFVFVDAPPGDHGRDATLLAAAPYLADGALAVLDDASRPREQTAVRRWERALGAQRLFESDAIGRGVAIVRIPHATSAGFSWRTFVGSIHDHLSY